MSALLGFGLALGQFILLTCLFLPFGIGMHILCLSLCGILEVADLFRFNRRTARSLL